MKKPKFKSEGETELTYSGRVYTVEHDRDKVYSVSRHCDDSDCDGSADTMEMCGNNCDSGIDGFWTESGKCAKFALLLGALETTTASVDRRE